MKIGACDICEAQNVELVRSELAGLETWSCWEECASNSMQKVPQSKARLISKSTDEKIEEAADKMISGQPLTRAEQRLLDSPQGDFAMGQISAILEARKR